jgi:flagellar biogenesis protein FliO
MGESALLLVRMLASLVVVGVLLWALAKMARNRGFSALGRGPIDVQAQRALNRSASLVLVRVGGRQLLLGVGEQGVQVLAEGDELVADLVDDAVDPTVDITDPAVGPLRLQPRLLESLRERTVRRGAG